MPRRVVALVLLIAPHIVFAARDVTPPTYANAAGSTSVHLLAANGETFLAAWTMNAGVPVKYGNLIASDGTVASALAYPVAVPLDATLLIRHGREYAAVSPGDASRITFVSADGRESRGSRVIPEARKPVAAASNGSSILLFDDDPRRFVLVRADGTTRAVDTPPGTTFAAITSAGDEFVVANATSTSLIVRWIDGGGAVASSVTISARVLPQLSIASNGDGALVLYPGGPTTPVVVQATHVRRNGTHTIRPIGGGAFAGFKTSIAWDGSNYVAAIPPSVYRFGEDGALVAQLGFGISAMPADALLAANPNLAYLIGRPFDSSGNATGVVGQPVRATIGPAEPLSRTLRSQISPAVASDGIDFTTAWIDLEVPRTRLAAIALDRFGNRLEPAQRDVTPQAFFATEPLSLTFGRSRYLITNETFNGTSGNMLLYARGLDDASSAFDGERFLVVWTGETFQVGQPNKTRLFGAFVKEDRTTTAPFVLVDFGPTALLHPMFPATPRVAFDGTQFLVIWRAVLRGQNVGGDVMALRVTREGTPIDTAPTSIASKSENANVASNRSGFLVVSDTYDGVVEMVPLYAGTAGAPVRVFRWLGSNINSNVSFDGRDYVIAWRYWLGKTGWIAMARTNGLVPSPAMGERAGYPVNDLPPAVASNNLGDTLAIVSEVTTSIPIPRLRAYTEAEMQPLPEPPLAPHKVKFVGSLIKWNAAGASAEAFVIEQNGVAIATLPADSRSYLLPVRLSGITIRAINAAGASEPQAIE